MVASARSGKRWLARLGGGVAWTAFVLAVAVAGSGLTLALDHPQNDSGRPELTYRGDAMVGPRLAAMAPQLAGLSAAMDTLGAHSRVTYGDVRSRNTAAARADLGVGDAAAAAVTTAAAAVQISRATLLDGTSLDGISQANRRWVAAIDLALGAANNVPASWTVIANAAVLPISMVETLSQHDDVVLAAADLARASDYAGATAKLTGARAILSTATDLVAQASKKGLDVTTITSLIARTTTYDQALLALYAILVQSGGVMTADANTALAAVNRALQALPRDTSALTIIVSDIGGQTMTMGLIDLEQLRGEIAAAVNRPAMVYPLQGVALR